MGLEQTEAEKLENNLWYNPDLLFKAKPVPGAVKLSEWLYSHGIGFPIISSRIDVVNNPGRIKNVREATYEWLAKYEPWVPEPDIYLQPKNELPGDVYKARLTQQLGCGIYFEDNHTHAQSVLDQTNSLVVLLSNVPFNGNNPRLRQITSDDTNLPNLSSVWRWVKKY